MKKQFLSLALALILTLALFPMSAFAVEGERNAVLSDITNYSEVIQQAVEDARPEVRDWVLANIGVPYGLCGETVDAFNYDVFGSKPVLDAAVWSRPNHHNNTWTYIEYFSGMEFESGDTLLFVASSGIDVAIIVASYKDAGYFVVIESGPAHTSPAFLSEYWRGEGGLGGDARMEGVLRPNFDKSRANNPLPDYEAPNLDTASDWAKPIINNACEKGFIPADLINHYKSNITRSEFAWLALSWLSMAKHGSPSAFWELELEYGKTDRASHEFRDTELYYILVAYRLGIISGTQAPTATTPGTFNPNGNITRQEAAVMIANLCRVANLGIQTVPTSDFTDLSTAGSWAHPGINFVRANGIMSGTSTTPPTFSPLGTYTREQAIVTFYNIFNNGKVEIPDGWNW